MERQVLQEAYSKFLHEVVHKAARLVVLGLKE